MSWYLIVKFDDEKRITGSYTLLGDGVPVNGATAIQFVVYTQEPQIKSFVDDQVPWINLQQYTIWNCILLNNSLIIVMQ